MECMTVMPWVNMYLYLSILDFFSVKLSLSGNLSTKCPPKRGVHVREGTVYR